MSRFLFAIMATLALLFSGSGAASAETQQCTQAKQSAVNLKAFAAQYPPNDGLKLLITNAEKVVQKYC
jgi:hypothetical protein